MSVSAEELLSAIQAAFNGVARSGISLRQFKLTDEFGMSREITDREWDDAGRRRTDSRWEDIPDSEIRECGVLLAHMQAPEFRYYLPAYMLRAVKELQDGAEQAELVGSVVHSVYPSRRDTSLRAYVLSQLSLLSKPQRQVIGDFLHLVAVYGSDFDRPHASKAIERFWNNHVIEHGFSTSVIEER